MRTLAKLQALASKLSLPGSLVASNRSGQKGYYYQPDPKVAGAGRQRYLGDTLKPASKVLRQIAQSFSKPRCRICRRPVDPGETLCARHHSRMTGDSDTLRRK